MFHRFEINDLYRKNVGLSKGLLFQGVISTSSLYIGLLKISVGDVFPNYSPLSEAVTLRVPTLISFLTLRGPILISFLTLRGRANLTK